MASEASRDAFANSTATRLTPDRAERWLKYFEVFSSTIPEEMSEIEFSDLMLSAWVTFRKQDDDAQAEAIARAWGIRQFKKVPRLQPRAKKPEATVVKPAVKRWEPCAFWTIDKDGRHGECSTHKHKPLDERQRELGSSVWGATGNQVFVRNRIRAELMPYTSGQPYPKFDDLEMAVWWNIAGQMRHYVPVREPDEQDQDGNVVRGKVIRKAEQGWIRQVVHGAVVDHFRFDYLDKRDVRRETPIAFDLDHGVPVPGEPRQAQAVRPKGTAPDDSADGNGEINFECPEKWSFLND